MGTDVMSEHTEENSNEGSQHFKSIESIGNDGVINSYQSRNSVRLHFQSKISIKTNGTGTDNNQPGTNETHQRIKSKYNNNDIADHLTSR